MGVSLGDIRKKTGDETMVRRATVSLGNLNKASQKTGVDLTKGLLECGMEVDASGSLRGAYSSGEVQETTDRSLAWIAVVDTSGAAEVGFFGTEAFEPTSLNLSNYRGWVRNNQPREFGYTNLYDAIVMGAKMAADALKAPRILDLIKAQAPKKSSGLFGRSGGTETRIGLDDSGRSQYVLGLSELRPIKTRQIYHFTIITDGAPYGGGPTPYESTINELIVRLSYAGIFIKFIFVGNDKRGKAFLDSLDDMPVARHQDDLADPKNQKDHRKKDVAYRPGIRYIDNVDTVEFPRGLKSVSDEEFAAAMTQELDTYVPSAVRRDLLDPANLVAVE